MATQAQRLGRRIVVVGTMGCGKTYVAEALAAKLGISYINNDAIIFCPNWEATPHEARVDKIDDATSAEAWTFDGNVAARHPEDRIVLERCDTIVWLDLPRWQVWSQVVRRTLARIVFRQELWHGNKESARTMLSRDSIILWSIKTFARRRRAYAAMFADPAYADRALIRLRNRREVDLWLAGIAAGLRSPACTRRRKSRSAGRSRTTRRG